MKGTGFDDFVPNINVSVYNVDTLEPVAKAGSFRTGSCSFSAWNLQNCEFLRACSNCRFLRSIDRKNPAIRALLEPAR
jgi:hypothetical protein